jgi:hypothetical protein
VSSPGTPTRSGFTFNGWDPALPTTITADRTFVAQWEPDGTPPPFFPPSFPPPTTFSLIAASSPSGIALAYNVSGIESGTSDEIFIVNIPSGTSYSLSAPSPVSGKIFDSWSGSSTSTSTTITGTVTANLNFTANYVDPPTVTATFNTDGGSPVPDAQSGFSPLSVTTPTETIIKTGHTFNGWSPSLPATITEDTTFTAQWTVTGPPPPGPNQTLTPVPEIDSVTSQSAIFAFTNPEEVLMDVTWTVRQGTIDGTVIGTGSVDGILAGATAADSITELTAETTYWLTNVVGTVSGKDPSNPATALSFTTLEPPAPPPDFPPPFFTTPPPPPPPPPFFTTPPPPPFFTTPPPPPPPPPPPGTQPPTFVPGEITVTSSRVIDISGAIDPNYNVQGTVPCTISWNLMGGSNPSGFNYSTTTVNSGTVVNSPGSPVRDNYAFTG